MCKKVLLNINIIIRYFNFRPEIRSASEFVSISEYKMECDRIEGFLAVITAMISKMLFFRVLDVPTYLLHIADYEYNVIVYIFKIFVEKNVNVLQY